MLMDLISFKKLNDAFKYALIGIFLYPIPVFLGHLFPGVFIDLIDKDLSFPQFIRYLLIVTPCFSIFFLIAAIKITKASIGIMFEKQIRIVFRIIILLYVISSITISVSAIFSNFELALFTNNFKTILWRGAAIFSFVYVSYIYYKLNELEWSIVSLGFLAISLFEDIYYYLQRIESLKYRIKSFSIDETLLLMSAIVLFCTVFLIINLKRKIGKAIKRKTPDEESRVY
ncbi:MAG: hypothetical protein ACEPO8_10580 [Rhodothermaceae bacterium]